MSSRLRAVAEANERIVREGRYVTEDGTEVVIGPAVEAARGGTRVYGPAPVDVPPDPRDAGGAPRSAVPAFEVTGEDSLAAARRLAGATPIAGAPGTGNAAEVNGASARDARIAVLVFASARNPGGGYVNGAKAQEEALCRASALYPCLLRAPEFYAIHREVRDTFYSDRVVHSPGVPVFRDPGGRLLARPFPVGFLTSPAPNAGVIARQLPDRVGEIPGVLARRAERVLEVAAAHGYRRLVLGAWGCGVFRNDPADVASAFAGHLTAGGRFATRFDEVVLAVWDRNAYSPTRAAFARAFGG